jgi:hypothetical protein
MYACTAASSVNCLLLIKPEIRDTFIICEIANFALNDYVVH